MDVASDDLTAPLGLRPDAPPSRLRKVPVARILAATGLVAFVAAGLYAGVFGDPGGGIPHVSVPIGVGAPEAAQTAAPVQDQVATPADHPLRRDADQVEAASGVSVVRPAGMSAPGAIIVQVPDEGPVRLAPAPDSRLVEKSRYGLLPRIGPDGARPLSAYARPSQPWRGATPPAKRIAIVVGGLGISLSGTNEAIAKLPPAVTLAFAPYGDGLTAAAARARDAGHEIMLQVPMEPFDYPESDPGPQTLTTSASPADNLDRLHWSMGRFTGYVGIVNYMGAKLTADAAAMTLLLRDIGGRGLAFLDDGSSSRSTASASAGDTPNARAVEILDADPHPGAIEAALKRLESKASAGRVVVATASALPATIGVLRRWADGLEARDIQLLPASAAFGSAPGASARR